MADVNVVLNEWIKILLYLIKGNLYANLQDFSILKKRRNTQDVFYTSLGNPDVQIYQFIRLCRWIFAARCYNFLFYDCCSVSLSYSNVRNFSTSVRLSFNAADRIFRSTWWFCFRNFYVLNVITMISVFWCLCNKKKGL